MSVYETLSSYFPPKTLWRSFFCAIVAELALELTDALHQGTLTIFEVAYVQSRASSNRIL